MRCLIAAMQQKLIAPVRHAGQTAFAARQASMMGQGNDEIVAVGEIEHQPNLLVEEIAVDLVGRDGGDTPLARRSFQLQLIDLPVELRDSGLELAAGHQPAFANIGIPGEKAARAQHHDVEGQDGDDAAETRTDDHAAHYPHGGLMER